jgi:hypothetical protein
VFRAINLASFSLALSQLILFFWSTSTAARFP